MTDDYTIAREQVADRVACRDCARWIHGRATVVRLHFPDGGSVARHYCDAGCATGAGFGWLVTATFPQPVRRLTVKAVCEATGANRATWHPSPIEDDRRREWTALCNESRKLNRRD